MSIESGLIKHFKQANGLSVAGMCWRVRIEHQGNAHHAKVTALLKAHTSRDVWRDERYQARATLKYLSALLESGWNPAHEREHTIEITDPSQVQPRPWWRRW